MANKATEIQIVSELERLIGFLCESVTRLEGLIEKPVFLDAETKDCRFRYEIPGPHILQVLMCVRIASGLRACLILLKHFHTTEMAVLFRTIDDFVGEIEFVDEVIENGKASATAGQKKFLEQYFVDEKSDPTNVPKTVDLGRRQKVQAAQARMLGGENPHGVKKLVKPIDDVLSGVVHGSYSSTMEMYGGESLVGAHFHTEGMPVRFSQYRHFLGLKIHEALNAFCKVAYNFGDHDLAHQLREERRAFEISPAYTTK